MKLVKDMTDQELLTRNWEGPPTILQQVRDIMCNVVGRIDQESANCEGRGIVRTSDILKWRRWEYEAAERIMKLVYENGPLLHEQGFAELHGIAEPMIEIEPEAISATSAARVKRGQ